MVTNNKYYKTIYENVTGLTVTGHHKNTYYMRKVCESYGVVYDEFKPLAMYVKDFATALEIDVGTKHKPLRTLLHMIAEELYSGSLEHDTVNYYLKIISENIVPPTPVAYNTTWTLNGVESGESAILSHADSQNAVFVFTVEDINGHPVSNCQIPVEVDGEAVSPIPTTDADGVASFTYASQGVGDVSVSADIMVNGILVSKRYEVHDYYFYDPLTSDSGHWNWDSTTTHTYSNNGVNFKRSSGNGIVFNTCKIDLPSEFEAEITYMGGTGYTIETIVGGMGWTYDVANQRSWGYYRTTTNSTQDQHNIEVTGAVQVGDVFKFVRQNGTLKIYQNDVEKWSMTAPTPLYDKIVFQTFANSRNTTLKDLKIKKL